MEKLNLINGNINTSIFYAKISDVPNTPVEVRDTARMCLVITSEKSTEV